MDIFNAELLERILSLSGICLWAITMFFFIYKKDGRIRENQKIDQFNRYNARSFNEEVYAQMVRQQSEEAFKRIQCVINTEKALLNELIEEGSCKDKGLRRRTKKPTKTRPHPLTLHGGYRSRSAKKPKDRYAEVLRLSDLGMNPKKISEKVKIPKGEIEMLIKLQKKKHQTLRKQSAGGMLS